MAEETKLSLARNKLRSRIGSKIGKIPYAGVSKFG